MSEDPAEKCRWRDSFVSFVRELVEERPLLVNELRARCFDDSDWAGVIDQAKKEAEDVLAQT